VNKMNVHNYRVEAAQALPAESSAWRPGRSSAAPPPCPASELRNIVTEMLG